MGSLKSERKGKGRKGKGKGRDKAGRTAPGDQTGGTNGIGGPDRRGTSF